MRIGGIAGFLGGMIVAMMLATAPASAQAGCGIQQAADLAVQKQLALLDASKVDSSKYFNGVNSCLGSNLLGSLDLSNLIPSSFDFLGSIGQNLIDNLIQQATQQVCEIINSQLQEIIGKINSQMGQFDSLIGSQMAELTGGSGSTSPISIPDISGFGQYNFTRADGSGTQPPTQPIITPPAGNAGTGNTGTGGTGTTNPAVPAGNGENLFDNIFNGNG